MKYLLPFILLIGFASCGDDNDSEIHYDGANFSAPELIVGTHEAAAKFTASFIQSNVGRNVEAVSYYLQSIPQACEIRIYDEGTNVEPGALLYSADVTASMGPNRWNTHDLSDVVTLADKDIWVVVRLVHTASAATIGCDEGPADSNGDWLWGDIDNEWITFRDRSSQQTDINWNIRMILSE